MPIDRERLLRISGRTTLILGLAALGAVACFHYPNVFVSPPVRDLYPLPLIRIVIASAIAIALATGLLSLLRGDRVAGAIGTLAALAAQLWGGPATPVGPTPDSHGYLGLDWLIIDALILAGVFFPLERLFPRRALPVLRRGLVTDLAYFAINHLLVPIIALVSSWFAVSAFGWAVSPRVQHFVQSRPVLLQVLAILLVTDLAQYWIHRAFHEVPFLWRFHAIHHSSEHMDVLAGSRVHLLETFATRAAVFVPLAVLGFPFSSLLIYAAVIALQATFIHANVRFRFGLLERLLVTPRYHHWHHSSDPEAIDTNYAGTFPFLDRLFGTHHLPRARWPQRYGVVKGNIPPDLLRQQLYPVIR
jgi:lathosterol oxidase